MMKKAIESESKNKNISEQKKPIQKKNIDRIESPSREMPIKYMSFYTWSLNIGNISNRRALYNPDAD